MTNIEELFAIIEKGESEKTEFKSNISNETGKTICAFLNTDGGVLLLGINDEGKIIGITKKYKEDLANILSYISPKSKIETEELGIDKKIIVIIRITKSDRLHSFLQIGYVRIGSTTRVLELREIVEKAGEMLLVNFDEGICKDIQREDIDNHAIEEYLKLREAKRGITIPKINQTMLYNQLKIQKNEQITNAGVLFFCPYPQRFYPQATLRIIDFKGDNMAEVLDEKTIEGSLWQIVKKTEEELKNRLKRQSTIKSFERLVGPNFPIEALREAILNALVHRNYFESADVRILIFPNRIEIINPGSFPPQVSLELPTHRTRNPILCQYFYDIGYIEKYGSGLIKMRQNCRENGFPEPEFTLSSMQTKVIFHLVPIWLREKSKDLDQINKRIIARLVETKEQKAGELMQLTALSRDSLVRRMNILINKKIVQKTGAGRGIAYRLLESF